MRRLVLLLAFLSLSLLPAAAQEIDAREGSRIRSAQVSGMDIDHLSPGLKHDINALVGMPLDWDDVYPLADRIESEQPETVAAIRAVRDPDGEARLIFFVARVSDDGGVAVNINARYQIEQVEIDGVPERQISQTLLNDLHALVGGRLDRDVIKPLLARLRQELPGYDIRRRVERGTQRGQIRVIFDVREGESLRWIHFVPSTSKFLYHSDQGWSGILDVPIGSRDFHVTPRFAFDNRDDLIEEYSGYGLRLEHRKIASDRVGISVELSRFTQTWQAASLAALDVNGNIAEAYRRRSAISPLVTVAVDRRVRLSAGVSVSELEPLSRSADSRMANVLVASIDYGQHWAQDESDHRIEAGAGLRSSSESLRSDLDYRRYFGSVHYEYRRGRNTAIASGMGGRMNGQAPLFERFSLGDSTTLRGWNKYDVAAAGGDRMFHTSLEYRSHGVAFFVDAGSVWDRDDRARIRAATGFGYHRDGFFLTFGFPLNADRLTTTFMIGVRF